MSEFGINSLIFPNSTSQNNERNFFSLLPVRVLDIILDNTHPDFESQGGWSGIGTIKFRSIYYTADEKNDTFLFAKPFLSNLKHYPLKNEIVFIWFLPNRSTLNNTNGSYYYLDTINIWNSIHHNALPDINNSDNISPEQRRDYIETSNGAVRKISDGSSEISLGNTFKEKPNINPLLPFEGDLLIEGRFGQSIRMGSTVLDSNISNLWSKTGNNGDPILIINNQRDFSSKEGWIPSLEDINKDNSSLYFCSSQKIPIKIACTNQNSFGITISNQNISNIILPDSNLPPPISQSNSNLDSALTSSIEYTSSLIISSSNNYGYSNNSKDELEFILPGDVIESLAEKSLEEIYFVPEELDLFFPPDIPQDLTQSEKIKTEGFIIPTAGKLTSLKSLRRDPLDNTKIKFHGGIDIANKPNTPIYASASGKIVRSDYSNSYGNIIIIYHEDKNMYSLYAHLNRIIRFTNTSVSQGELIGFMGSTGRSTGTHLHFEIIQGTNFGNPDFYSRNYKQNPLDYI